MELVKAFSSKMGNKANRQMTRSLSTHFERPSTSMDEEAGREKSRLVKSPNVLDVPYMDDEHSSASHSSTSEIRTVVTQISPTNSFPDVYGEQGTPCFRRKKRTLSVQLYSPAMPSNVVDFQGNNWEEQAIQDLDAVEKAPQSQEVVTVVLENEPPVKSMILKSSPTSLECVTETQNYKDKDIHIYDVLKEEMENPRPKKDLNPNSRQTKNKEYFYDNLQKRRRIKQMNTELQKQLKPPTTAITATSSINTKYIHFNKELDKQPNRKYTSFMANTPYRRSSAFGTFIDDCSVIPFYRGNGANFTSLKDLPTSMRSSEEELRSEKTMWWKPLLVSNKYCPSEDRSKVMDFTWSANINKLCMGVQKSKSVGDKLNKKSSYNLPKN